MSVSMDDTSMFFQWAMETLQQDHPPPPAAATYAVLQELRRPEHQNQNGTAPAEVAAQDVQRDSATNSWSSGADSGRAAGIVAENDGWPWSPSYPPVSSHLTSTMAHPTIHDEATPTTPARAPGVPEPAHISPASRKSSASSSGTGHTSPDPCVRGHVMAERKRREKINRRLIELSAVIPGLKKMDKGTILSDALRYIMEQQAKLKELERRNAVLLVKRPCVAREPGGTKTTTTRSSLPELEARISDGNVMVKIHCEDGKGVLVRLLAVLEELHLSLTHTNSIPFPACTVNITITAKVDEGFNIAHEDIIGKLEAALRRRNGDH